jgi:hypothetical protein
MEKTTCQLWSTLGYQSRCQLFNAVQVGGSVDQEYLIVARLQDAYVKGWEWPPITESAIRPMAHCLKRHSHGGLC